MHKISSITKVFGCGKTSTFIQCHSFPLLDLKCTWQQLSPKLHSWPYKFCLSSSRQLGTREVPMFMYRHGITWQIQISEHAIVSQSQRKWKFSLPVCSVFTCAHLSSIFSQNVTWRAVSSIADLLQSSEWATLGLAQTGANKEQEVWLFFFDLNKPGSIKGDCQSTMRLLSHHSFH